MDLRKINLDEVENKISHEQRVMYASLTRDQVLALSELEKLRYFASLQVGHKELIEAEATLTKILLKPGDQRIVPIIGPTGTGKSLFCETVIQPRFRSPRIGEMPYIYVEAFAHGTRKGDFTGVQRQILRHGGEIMTNDKFLSVTIDGKITLLPEKATQNVVRDALKLLLKWRNVKVLVIDEFVHLLRDQPTDAKKNKNFQLMDAVKSVANDMNNGVLVLVGGAELFAPVVQYGQVARRQGIVYLARYLEEDEAIARAAIATGKRKGYPPFEEVVRKLTDRWPLPQVPRFYDVMDEIFTATLGLVGLLKTLLGKCLVEQLVNNGDWDPNFFITSVLPSAALDVIRTEVEAGEKKMREEGFGVGPFDEEAKNGISDRLTAVHHPSTKGGTS